MWSPVLVSYRCLKQHEFIILASVGQKSSNDLPGSYPQDLKRQIKVLAKLHFFQEAWLGQDPPLGPPP